MFILNQLWYVEMNLDKSSSEPYSNILYAIGVIACSLTFIILWVVAIDTEQEAVASDPLWSQVLRSCWQRGAVPVHECVDVAYEVKRVLDLEPVVTKDVPNHNSGPSSAILPGLSGNCQSSMTYGGWPIADIDQKCQVWHPK